MTTPIPCLMSVRDDRFHPFGSIPSRHNPVKSTLNIVMWLEIPRDNELIEMGTGPLRGVSWKHLSEALWQEEPTPK